MPLRPQPTAPAAARSGRDGGDPHTPGPAGRGWSHSALLRCALLSGTASLGYACSHAWDDYDPRLTGTASSSSSASTSGSSSSSSGTVDGGACTPGATQDCVYAGPPSTNGMGPCKPGTQTCGADGTWGSDCAGKVLPLLEDCTNDVDDDCNGTVNDHCAVWSMGFGVTATTGGGQIYGVAASPQGQVRVIGGSHGGSLVSVEDAGLADGSTGAFSIDIDASPPAYVESLGGGNNSVVTAAAFADNGDGALAAAVYGNQEITVLGLPPLKSATVNYEWDSLVARLSGSSGVWQTMLSGAVGTSAFVQTNAMTWNGAKVYVGGTFTGSSDFGLDGDTPDAGADAGDAGSDAGDDIFLTSKNTSGFVVRLDASGQAPVTVWQLKLGDSAASVYSVTSAAGATLVAAGAYDDGNLKIGTKAFPGTGQPAGMVVSIAENSGIPQRVITYPTTSGAVSAVHVDSIATDPTSPDVIVAGRFSGPVQFGVAGADVTDGGTPTPDAGGGTGCTLQTPGGASDLFVARLRVSDLSCLWVQTLSSTLGFDGPNNSGTPNAFAARTQGFGPQVAVDASGNVILSANFASTVTVGTWPLTPVGTSSVLLLSLDPTGSVNWVRSFGTDRAYVTGMALDGTGAVLLVGHFLGALQFEPDHALTWSQASGHDGMFIAKIAP